MNGEALSTFANGGLKKINKFIILPAREGCIGWKGFSKLMKQMLMPPQPKEPLIRKERQDDSMDQRPHLVTPLESNL